jgi:subtilisin family serine protease
VILDTGLAMDYQRPPSLNFVKHPGAGWEDAPDTEPDGYLDPAVGHGTFIAGLIDSLAPGCDISIVKVLKNLGDGDEWSIAHTIQGLGDHDLLNLSFGGYTLGDMDLFAAAVAGLRDKGTVVVASAGNDATWRPCYPAAFDDVIGVAALSPTGPAMFSNYGDWVQACAPGVDLVSTFFMDVQGPEPAPTGYPEPDRYLGWTRWSGTSFSAPVVVAALAREMRNYELKANEAVARVIDAPGLFRIPSFGTVVNLQ